MILTLTAVLVAAAFLCTMMSAGGKWPLWVPVLLLVLVELIRLFPAR